MNCYQQLFLTRLHKAVPDADGKKDAAVAVSTGDPTKSTLYIDGQKWQKQQGTITAGSISTREKQTLQMILRRIFYAKKKAAFIGGEVKSLYQAFKYSCKLYKYYKKQIPQLETAYKTHMQYYITH